MSYPLVIQGGMGVAVSGWCLAKAVSMAGQLGIVSGTALEGVVAMRLQAGDTLGHMRRGLTNFPIKDIGNKIIDKFFISDGVDARKLRHEMPSAHMSEDKENEIVASSFAEIFLAKEGHKGIVGINLLEKIQIPNLASIYGSLLAGVDYIIMGAGIPRDIPAIIEKLVCHEPVSCRMNIDGADSNDDYRLSFDPTRFGLSNMKLKKPKFLAIVSSNILAMTLMKKSAVKPDGIIIEGPTAGGHNAPPRIQGVLNEAGEPIYGEKDAVDLAKIRELGIPFWLAGSYGKNSMLKEALAEGAAGIQAGTVFALCKESGMYEDIKRRVLAEHPIIKTDPFASPTGFPFKVAQMKGTIADPEVYSQRKRTCNLGYLRQPYKKEDGSIGYRCGSEPVSAYVRKGGKEEDTVGRICLCNGLYAAAGYALDTPDGKIEAPLVTIGDDLSSLKGRQYGYTAAEVIKEMIAGIEK